MIWSVAVQRKRVLGLQTLAGRILLKKEFKQDVGQDVLTCWCDIIACLVPFSWRLHFKREIPEDLIYVYGWPRSMWLLEAEIGGYYLACFLSIVL